MKITSDTKGKALQRFASILSLGALALALGLTGCVTPGRSDKIISIDSDPQGVRVEVNGEDLGKTPTSYTAQVNKKGDFAGAWGESPTIMFVAFPPDDDKGLYKQTKAFSPSAFMESGDRVPTRIYFDMYQKTGR